MLAHSRNRLRLKYGLSEVDEQRFTLSSTIYGLLNGLNPRQHGALERAVSYGKPYLPDRTLHRSLS